MSDLSKTCDRLGNGAARLVLSARLSDLDGYWLELHCCAGTTLIPVHLLFKQRGNRERLSEILPKLACKLCGSPPRRAWLNETHNRTQTGGTAPGWSVQLIPAAESEATG